VWFLEVWIDTYSSARHGDAPQELQFVCKNGHEGF
jgi:hypothetical protein